MTQGRRHNRPAAPFELWRLAGNTGAEPEFVATFPTMEGAQVFARALYRAAKAQFKSDVKERNHATFYAPTDARDTQWTRYVIMDRPARKVSTTHEAGSWGRIHVEDLWADED